MVKLELSVPGPPDRETKIYIQAHCVYGDANALVKPFPLGDDGKRFHIHAGIQVVELLHTKGVVITQGAVKQSIKHPIDVHEPVKELKKAFGELMTELDFDKLHRTLLWRQILDSFDFNQFANLYTNLVLTAGFE